MRGDQERERGGEGWGGEGEERGGIRRGEGQYAFALVVITVDKLPTPCYGFCVFGI